MIERWVAWVIPVCLLRYRPEADAAPRLTPEQYPQGQPWLVLHAVLPGPVPVVPRLAATAVTTPHRISTGVGAERGRPPCRGWHQEGPTAGPTAAERTGDPPHADRHACLAWVRQVIPPQQRRRWWRWRWQRVAHVPRLARLTYTCSRTVSRTCRRTGRYSHQAPGTDLPVFALEPRPTHELTAPTGAADRSHPCIAEVLPERVEAPRTDASTWVRSRHLAPSQVRQGVQRQSVPPTPPILSGLPSQVLPCDLRRVRPS